MARYSESVCRLCRREGMKLFLKGDRCFTDKCAIERRNYPPGQHGRAPPKLLGYGIQLREKQKVKRIYGLLERQFRLYFARAERRKGITGENLLGCSSAAWTTSCTRSGFAASRAQARQLVRHGHVAVNGRKVNDPVVPASPRARSSSIKEKSRTNAQITAAVETARARGVPAWLELTPRTFSGTVVDAAEARRHQAADPGAADRRAVLQVSRRDEGEHT